MGSYRNISTTTTNLQIHDDGTSSIEELGRFGKTRGNLLAQKIQSTMGSRRRFQHSFLPYHHHHTPEVQPYKLYFKHIFAIVHPLCPPELQNYTQPVITLQMKEELAACPTHLEVYHAVFAMGNYKSSGPDGMSLSFYKHY